MSASKRTGALLGIIIIVLAVVAALFVRGPRAPTAPLPREASKPADPAAADAAAAPPTPHVAVDKPAVPATAAAPKAAPAPLKAVRQIPRKRLPKVALDLDGDGKPEQLLMRQLQPAAGWRGKDKSKGPHFVMEIRATRPDGSPGALIGKKERYGWGQGWAQIGVRTGGGSHVAMVYWAVPEAHEPRASYAWLVDGKVKWGEFSRLPLDLVDLHFGNNESVLTLSQELYHNFLKRGTTELLSWTGGAFQSLLSEPAFEICVVAVREPHVYLALVAQNKRTLKIVRAPEAPGMPIDEVWSLAVTPPSEGPAYTVPTGFALSCNRQAERMQYKRKRFKFAGDSLIALPDAPATGQAAQP